MPLPEPLPVIDRGPVRLRAFTYADVPLVKDASTDPSLLGITTVPATSGQAEARAYVDRQRRRAAEGLGCSFAVADAVTDEAVGQVGLWVHGLREGRASIGYWVGPSHRRGGWATHALRAVSTWGFTLPGIERLELYVEPWNEPSWRTAERAGYLREGLMRSWEAVGGERRDMYMYSLLPSDLPAVGSDACASPPGT